MQDCRSLIVAVISVIHIASLICPLFTQSSHMSLSSLMYPFRPAPLLSPSPHLHFLSFKPLSLSPSFHSFPSIYFTHLHDPLPPSSCSLITHKLTLKASIIAYVKTHTNAHCAPYLTGLILSPCTLSPAPLIHTFFMLND